MEALIPDPVLERLKRPKLSENAHSALHWLLSCQDDAPGFARVLVQCEDVRDAILRQLVRELVSIYRERGTPRIVQAEELEPHAEAALDEFLRLTSLD